MSDKLTAEKFLADVKNHRLTIMHDSETMRCLRLAEPASGHYHFTLTTWPGYLCISGDMGCFVFARVPDMFTFFRDSELKINAEYWAEKVQAQDMNEAVSEYDADRFRDAVESYMEDRDVDDPVRAMVKDRVLSYAEHGEYVARRAVDRFEYPGFSFVDFWEYSLRDFTCRFLWCCYAIVWGIQQYDAAKATPEKMTRADEFNDPRR